MQRPLKTIAKRSGDVYIPRGVSVPALDKDILWEFQPKKIGNHLLSLSKSTNIVTYGIYSCLHCCFWPKFSEFIIQLSIIPVAGEGDLLTGGDLYAVS